MLVAHIQEDYQLGLSDMPMPGLPPKGALVRLLGCGLCGSDLDKLMHQKAHPGSVLGHEIVGIIDALDDQHPSGWKLGERIVAAHHVPCEQCHYCLNDSQSMCRQFKATNLNPGGFSQYIALSEDHLRHTTFKVPPAISSGEASCVEPLACVLRAVRRGGTYVNGSVAMVGLGFIGLMAAQVYQNDGYAVYGLELDVGRLDLARAQGFVMDAFHPAQEMTRLKETLTRHTQVGQVDLVFLTVVNPKTIEMAFELVRDGGTIIVFTSATHPSGQEASQTAKQKAVQKTAQLSRKPTAQEASLDHNFSRIDPSRLYFREINLITSYSPGLEDLQEAARMIFNEKIKVKPLISHYLPLSEIRQAVTLYQNGQALKVFIQMEAPV